MANIACRADNLGSTNAGIQLPGSDGKLYTVKPGAVTVIPDAVWAGILATYANSSFIANGVIYAT